jgi:predicted RND superfamily exporter protein
MALVLCPLLLAAAATAGVSVVFSISFNFANVIVLPLLLGIGVDSGVHMVHRYRESSTRIDASSSAETAGRSLLGTSTAQAVFFSALTTIASFGSLALSSHVGFSSLGKLLVIGVTLTLVCNLVVLPALIAYRENAGREPATDSARAET